MTNLIGKQVVADTFLNQFAGIGTIIAYSSEYEDCVIVEFELDGSKETSLENIADLTFKK